LSDAGDAVAFGRATARGNVGKAFGAFAAVTAALAAATSAAALRGGDAG
jgi:hypothetical protein